MVGRSSDGRISMRVRISARIEDNASAMTRTRTVIGLRSAARIRPIRLCSSSSDSRFLLQLLEEGGEISFSLSDPSQSAPDIEPGNGVIAFSLRERRFGSRYLDYCC